MGARQSFPSLLLDIEYGASAAVQHLLSLGHRRIAHLAAHIDVETFRVRQRVYERLLSEAGNPAADGLPGDGRRRSRGVL